MRVSFVFVVLTILFGASFVSANDCPKQGERRAVATDAAVQNKQITVGTCYDPQNAVAINQGAEEAKQYLKSIFKPVTSCTPADEQINRVDAAFATCAARFLKEFNSRYGGAVITRAYNSVQCETDMCKRGPPGVGNTGCGGFAKIAVSGGAVVSNHVRSVAMDVSAGSKQEQMIAFAHQNPQFGMCFPVASWDKVHMVLGGVPGGERCAQVPKPCDGVNFDPNSIQNPDMTNFRNTQNNPTAGPQSLANAIRSYTNPPANTLGTNQPLSASTQNTISSIFAMPATTTTSVTTDTTATTTQASSTIDILTTIALGASDIATSTSITSPSVTINSGDAVFLNPNVFQNLQSAQNQFVPDPSFPSSQTFTSPDLNPTVYQSPQNLSRVEATIRDIRARLDSILQYVRPFGAVHQVTPLTY